MEQMYMFIDDLRRTDKGKANELANDSSQEESWQGYQDDLEEVENENGNQQQNAAPQDYSRRHQSNLEKGKIAIGPEERGAGAEKNNRQNNRHDPKHVYELEKFFMQCPNPDEAQRKRLSELLGIEPSKVKFWFQNKRTQTKVQTERAENSALRAELERIQHENESLRCSLECAVCPTCRQTSIKLEKQECMIHQMQQETIELKHELGLAYDLLQKALGRPVTSNELFTLANNASSAEPTQEIDFFGAERVLGHEPNYGHPEQSNQASVMQIQGLSLPLLFQSACSAMDELLRLSQVNEPMWSRSQIFGGYILRQDSYPISIIGACSSKNPFAKIEASKDSALVSMPAARLAEMFLDEHHWVSLFQTIVTKARIIQKINTGTLGGSLQLMYAYCHILSPVVAPREFYFIRYVKQIDASLWVIVDVSFDFFKETGNGSSVRRSWKLPSGCTIRDCPNAKSRVTWIENVIVDDQPQNDNIYRDLIVDHLGFGARRWVCTLQRSIERFSYYSKSRNVGDDRIWGTIVGSAPDGRRNVMKLSNHMIRIFCLGLNTTDSQGFLQLSTENKDKRIAISTIATGEVIMHAATSLKVPLPYQTVFNFFRDEKVRGEWDVLSDGKPSTVIARIATGGNFANCISLLRLPIDPRHNKIWLQESFIDSTGGLVIYSPLDVPLFKPFLFGEIPSVPLIPSGLIITNDGRLPLQQRASSSSGATSSTTPKGSIVTLAIQIVLYPPLAQPSQQLCWETAARAAVANLLNPTVERIKLALGCIDDR